MQIKMAGSYTPYDFSEAMDCIVQCLRLNGVDEIRSIDIRLNLYHCNSLIEFEDQETGAPFRILRYQGRSKRDYRIVSPRLRPENDVDDGPGGEG